VTDARTQAAHAAWKQAAALRDGAADMEKLPVAESRARQPVARKLTARLIDALVELAYCDHVAEPPAALARAACSRRARYSRHCIAESLALIFPAEAHAAR